MNKIKYPYSKPTITFDDINEVTKVLKSEFLTQGKCIESFEKKLATTFSVKYAIACNSGTAALHMVYNSLGLNSQNGIITSPITFLATANAAKMCNAPVDFADVDPISGNVNLRTIKEAIKKATFKVKLIVLVHLGGRPCEIADIFKYANKKGIKIIEDACHAPLSKYYDPYIGLCTVGSCKHSEAVTLSLHSIKHFTSGEGGVILTNSLNIFEKCKLLRSHYMEKNKNNFLNQKEINKPWYYEATDLGYNYRLSEINSALALSQLKRIFSNIKKRNILATYYNELLKNYNGITPPALISRQKGLHSWHLYSIKVDFQFFKKTREYVMKKLLLNGIGTQVHYIPLYKQPIYSNIKTLDRFEGAENYYKSTLSIPMYDTLTKSDIDGIVKYLLSILNDKL